MKTKPIGELTSSFSVFLSSIRNLFNLVIIVYLYSAASFTYYLINFAVKYLPGSIFENMIVSSISEIFAAIVTGIFVKKLGPKLAFTVTFAICTISCFMLLFAVTYDGATYIPTLLIFAKLGSGSGLSMTYMNTQVYFPNQF